MCVTPVFASQNAEALDPRGRTLLHLAVSLGHLESARVLLRHKADVTKENGQGWTGKYPCHPRIRFSVSEDDESSVVLSGQGAGMTR
jgi:ankyrin repeat protein